MSDKMLKVVVEVLIVRMINNLKSALLSYNTAITEIADKLVR